MHLRFFSLMIIITLLVSAGKAQSIQSSLDSASYFADQGKLTLARASAERAIQANRSAEEVAKAYALLGAILEEDGYVILAIDAYRKGRAIASQHGQQVVLAKVVNGITSIQIAMGQYDSVLYQLNQSRHYDTTTRNSMSVYQVEGKYWQTQNQYDKALAVFQHALDRATALNDRKNIAIILSSIGSIYFSHDRDMNHALDFYRRSNTYCDSLRHASILARNYGRSANAYMVLGDLSKAEMYLKRARAFVDRCDNHQLRSYILSSWATFLMEQGKMEEAAVFAEEPIRIKRELGQQRQLQNDLLNIGETYIMIKQYDKARKALEEGTAISYSLHDIVYLKYFYNTRALLDSTTGNYKDAFVNLKRSMAFKDSTFSVDHFRAVNEVKEKYEAEQKEKIIAEKELELKQKEYEQAILIGASVTTVLVLLVILIIVRNRNRSKLQQEKIRQRQVQLQTIVQTQEDVQQRIARDLHDGLVQVLGAAKMSLESVRPDCTPVDLQKQIKKTSGILDEAVTEARSISHQVLPYSLIKGGLIVALEELFERSLEQYDFNKSGDAAGLSENKAINIYRIVQEMVNNVQKHAGATHVDIQLTSTLKEFQLTFQDNGRGFDTSTTSTGAGLSNMMTRAELMGGSIVFRSGVEKGTRITLTVPA